MAAVQSSRSLPFNSNFKGGTYFVGKSRNQRIWSHWQTGLSRLGE